ncbi:MAG TPA: guanylate kinase, partial [Bacteroidales bacterium]
EKLVIFSAPSGSGKTTLAKYLLAEMPQLAFSVSAASRNMRTGEIDGKDYYFLSIEDFKKKIANNEFVEYEEVYPNHFYGTLFSEIERIWAEGKAVLFDVDVVGGANLKKIFGKKALAVFVRPPSLNILKERLQNRATDSEEAIKTRLSKAEYEMTFEKKFDIVIVNDNLEKAKIETLEVVQNFIEK